MNRENILLSNCVGYIIGTIGSYSDTIDIFKKLGFTTEELINYGIIDYDFEEELRFREEEEEDL